MPYTQADIKRHERFRQKLHAAKAESENIDFYASEGFYPEYEHTVPKPQPYGTLAELHQQILDIEEQTQKKVVVPGFKSPQ